MQSQKQPISCPNVVAYEFGFAKDVFALKKFKSNVLGGVSMEVAVGVAGVCVNFQNFKKSKKCQKSHCMLDVLLVGVSGEGVDF